MTGLEFIFGKEEVNFIRLILRKVGARHPKSSVFLLKNIP